VRGFACFRKAWNDLEQALHVAQGVRYDVTCNRQKIEDTAMTALNDRLQRHRDALRAAGLRPLQIWVPDTRREGFAAECRRQSRLVAQADAAEADLLDFMDDALAGVEGWTE